MNLEEILENAKEREITREEALYLFRETRTYDKTLQLFQVASEVRDKEAGRVFKLHGRIGSITPCTVKPPCKYCPRSSPSNISGTKLFNKESVLTLEELSVAAKLIEKTGIKVVDVFGGTMVGSDGEKVVETVKTIKSASNLDITIHVGPCLSEETLLELKRLGVKEVGSALETTNEKLFREVKPGDSFEARKKLAETIDNIGLGLYTVLMVGLDGSYSYEDYVDQMFYLKKFENLSCLTVAGFNPIPGTPLENHPHVSPLETARTGAIARLVFRDIDIRIGGHFLDLPFLILAGANRTLGGASITKGKVEEIVRPSKRYHGRCLFAIEEKKINDLQFSYSLPAITKFVREAWMEVE